MADYKRFVSYMYEYEDGHKKRNVGYARVETRNGECRFTIHMQLNGIHEGIFPTYLIYRPKEEMDLIYLGDCTVKNQIMDSRLSANEHNIMDSGYDFSDMGGILLFLNSEVFFATQWDDKPVVLEEVLQALKPKPAKKPTDTLSDTSKKSEDTEPRRHKYIFHGGGLMDRDPIHPGKNRHINPWDLVEKYREVEGKKEPEYDARAAWQEVKEHKEEIKAAMDEEKADGYEIEAAGDLVNNYEAELTKDLDKAIRDNDKADERAEKPAEEAKEVNAGREAVKEAKDNAKAITDIAKATDDKTVEKEIKVSVPEAKEAENEANASKSMEISNGRQNDNPIAARIFASFPRIYPFEDNEITRCVKVDPKDIGALPSDTWIMSNNSFLLHGYYCYHHLIFAEIADRYGSRYILGVPGIYHNRERFMARMFGFECFKSIRKRELRQGDFGYWYREVSL